MKKVLLTTTLFLVVALTSCKDKDTPDPVKTDIEYCQAAENNIKNNLPAECSYLADPEQWGGKTFTEFCRETQENGVFLNPKCLASAVSCEDLDVCTNSQ